jgi:hypothetical protein
MYNILTYNLYLLNEQINSMNESIYVDYNELIKTVNGKKLELQEKFKTSKTHDNLYSLYNDDIFNKDINSKNIHKTKIEYSNDYDTYLNKSQTIKFFCLSREDSSKLDIKYIIIQVKNIDEKWGDIELYEINTDIRRFYDGLSTRTIEIIYDDVNYIYMTSNSGENWILKNIEKETDTFKRDLSIEELRELLKNKKYKIDLT